MESQKTNILVIDDEKKYREVYKTLLTENGYFVNTASEAEEAIGILKNKRYNLVLLDLILPETNGIEVLKKIKDKFGDTLEVIMVTGYGSIDSAVKAMKSGAFGYFIKSSDPASLLLEIEKAEKMNKLLKSNKALKTQIKDDDYLLKSKNEKMEEVIDIARRAAASKANILITGESGVGKEVMAKFIHQQSLREKTPFVTVNCASFSENILESELFGHVKGAFTGAIENRKGKIEEADGGTLFLDEIGEIPLELQVKLLRVLEEREISPVGSNKRIPIDFRLISASKRNIKKMVKNNKFREDLFYRINTISFEILPLRKRKEDLKDFISYFFKKFSRETNTKIRDLGEGLENLLIDYDYPGNIRELKNIIERLVVLSTDGKIDKKFLPVEVKKNERNFTQELNLKNGNYSLKKARKKFEAKFIKKSLEKNDNNITQTAKKLKISRRHLSNKIKEYNLKNN
ncbi:MAG TPA: sigma-54 dependent transcriptional regulator [Halanaerobiales bacterium]|nr:sigma-54 dependent transcriptional regulator [Halanaerobiales bacterium]